jgi:tetratricopeptide (TPR) repeat protein
LLSEESAEMTYRHLSFENLLFTARVYKRNFRPKAIVQLFRQHTGLQQKSPLASDDLDDDRLSIVSTIKTPVALSIYEPNRKVPRGQEIRLTSQGHKAVARLLLKKGADATAKDKDGVGPEHPDTLTSMNELCLALSRQGKYAEAAQMHRQTLELRKKVSGPEHPDTLTSMNNLALALSGQGKYEEAEQMHWQELELMKKVSGPEHPDTLTSMNNLALALSGQGKYEEAEQMHWQALELRKKAL